MDTEQDHSTSNIDDEVQEYFSSLTLFVGNNAHYYMRKWYVMVTTKQIFGWNWAAFFLPWGWLAYRKMYVWSFSFLVVTFILGEVFPDQYTLIWFILSGVLSIFANYLYYIRAVRRVMSCLVTIDDPDQRACELIKRGGTSWWAVILVAAVFFVFGYLLLPDTMPIERSPGVEQFGI